MRRRVLLFALAAALTLGPTRAFPQMSNTLYLLTQETMASSGGAIGGGNPMRVQTALGLPAAGRASNGVFTLIGGLGVISAAPTAPVTSTVTVTGAVDDPAAAVTVNGAAAAVTGNTFTAQGVLLSLGPNTITAVARDSLGNTASRSMIVILDLPASRKTGRFSINVTGAVNEPGAAVSVNGVAAAASAGQFTASVPLTSGLNTLRAVAADAAGNTTEASIQVFVPLPASPPARPTVGTVGQPIPAVTTARSLTLGGTKIAGASIWINGVQVVSLNSELTWTATVTLVEGDNEFAIVAKDASGSSSAPATVTVVVDNAPPVVTCAPPAKTNLNPFALTGSVDDHLTTLTVNGVIASRSGRTFTALVPLDLGANALVLQAVSPNGYATPKAYSITLGTIPTITFTDPADRAKWYTGVSATSRVAAADQESDPLQYRILLDGAPLADWGSANTAAWTPSPAQLGAHVLTLGARDGFGGERTKDVRVLVIRKPIDHP